MDFIFLSKTPLFRGMTPQEIETLLNCLTPSVKTFQRGSIIYHAGDIISTIGIVLSGSVSIENDDVWGNKSILDHIGPRQAFAETYACTPGIPLLITAAAIETSEILFLNVGHVLHVCSNACGFHNKLIQNLLFIASQKNLQLSWRIFHTSSKSIRGRLLSYLSFQASQQGTLSFEIPFNRQQLADYLSVDRSAMSNELSKMQKDGLIEFHRNHFSLVGIHPENRI